jgi:hypothetical protein
MPILEMVPEELTVILAVAPSPRDVELTRLAL